MKIPEASSWGNPEQTGAAVDFRSDVITTPSPGMLAAISRASLNDDVYGEDATTAAFEHEIAELCGHEAAAFVTSGTMANQLALRVVLHQPPHAILADASAHIIHFEAGGVANLSGAMVQAIRPINGLHLTLQDVKKHAILAYDVHKCPTRVISVENTTSGTLIPLQELQGIKSWATAHGLAVHIDGARLWEAVAASGHSIRDFAQCCDVLTVDFSKNLGAPIGAMVVGSRDQIARLKRIRKSIGGGLRQAGVLVAAVKQAKEENFGPGVTDTRGVLIQSHQLAQRVGRMWTQRGGRLLRPVETNMAWLDLKGMGIDSQVWNDAGKRRGIKLDGKRVVLHRQISGKAMKILDLVMEDMLGPAKDKLPISTAAAHVSQRAML